MQIQGLNSPVYIFNLVWFPWHPSVSPLLDALLLLSKHMCSSFSNVNHPVPCPFCWGYSRFCLSAPEHPCHFTQVIASPVTALYGTGTIASSKKWHLLSAPAADISPSCYVTPCTHTAWPPPNYPNRPVTADSAACSHPLVQLPSLFISSVPRSAFKKSIVPITKQTSEF